MAAAMSKTCVRRLMAGTVKPRHLAPAARHVQLVDRRGRASPAAATPPRRSSGRPRRRRGPSLNVAVQATSRMPRPRNAATSSMTSASPSTWAMPARKPRSSAGDAATVGWVTADTSDGDERARPARGYRPANPSAGCLCGAPAERPFCPGRSAHRQRASHQPRPLGGSHAMLSPWRITPAAPRRGPVPCPLWGAGCACPRWACRRPRPRPRDGARRQDRRMSPPGCLRTAAPPRCRRSSLGTAAWPGTQARSAGSRAPPATRRARGGYPGSIG